MTEDFKEDEQDFPIANMTNEQMAVLFRTHSRYLGECANYCIENIKKEGFSDDKAYAVLRPIFFYQGELDKQTEILAGVGLYKLKYEKLLSKAIARENRAHPIKL